MNRRSASTLLACVLISVLPSALADTWPAARPSVFASDRGRYAVKTRINEDSRSATATVFTLTKDGKEKTVWSQNLGYVPDRLLVSDRAWLVGVNEYARQGYAHSLVVWAPDGKRLADYKLEALLTADEISTLVVTTASSRRWTHGAHFEFAHDGYIGLSDLLVIRLMWEKTIVVDLRTGRISASEASSSIPEPMAGLLDDAVFVKYAEGTPSKRIACRWDGAGGFVCTGRLNDEERYTLRIAADDEGRWKTVTLDSCGGTRSLIREGTLVYGGRNGSTAKLCLRPRSAVYYFDYAPGLLSQLIRLYDRAKGGEQSFSLITPHMRLYDETSSYDARLRYIDSQVREIDGQAIEFHRYVTVASCIWADDDGRIYLIENPYRHITVVREGFESLGGQSASLFEGSADAGP